MFRAFVQVLPILVIFVAAGLSQISQEDGNEIFKDLPVVERSRLIDRLNQFIEFERSGRWEESYRLISDTHKQRLNGGKYMLEDYRKEKGIKIKKFSPSFIQGFNNKTVLAAKPVNEVPGHYLIEGCGRARGGSKGLSVIEAYWEKGDWFFSGMEILGMHKIVACSRNIKR